MSLIVAPLLKGWSIHVDLMCFLCILVPHNGISITLIVQGPNREKSHLPTTQPITEHLEMTLKDNSVFFFFLEYAGDLLLIAL